MSSSDDINASLHEKTEVDSEGRSRFTAATDLPAFPHLTGRDTEVSLLADRWEQAQEGMGQVVTIVGDAGLGKSRLVQTIKQSVLAEAHGDPSRQELMDSPIIEWRCSPQFQNTSLRPVADYFERLLAFGPEDSVAARFDCLASCLEGCGLRHPEAIALFARLLFLPPDERYPATVYTAVREREETFRILREWLSACARQRPILFVIEDLHWLDASSLEFLGRFTTEGLHNRILTVLTFRPEFRAPWPAMAHHTNLALNRLTRRQVAELMRRNSGLSLSDDVVTQIYQRTGGVPLLVEEFTWIIRASTGAGPASGWEIPATLQQLIAARLDTLSSNRDVAHFAATLGNEFHYEMLSAVVGLDESTLEAELTKLTSAGILHVKGRPPRCAYLFKHALVEEALYGALEETRRQQLHRQVAEIMEARLTHAPNIPAELLAQHFTEAGLVDKAVSYWLLAGRQSHERFANVEAIGHLSKGLELLRRLDESGDRDARELELLGPLGTAYIAARGYAAEEVGPVFQRARSLSERLGRTQEAFVMLRGHFAYHIVRGDLRLCTELATEALQLAERASEPGILMEALFLQGLTRLYRGDFAGASECCARALADYDDRERTAFWAERTGENSGVAHRCYLALALWHLGLPDRALAMNREAGELARSLGHPFSLAYALHHTGWLCQHCRVGAQTQAAGDEQMRVATEQGFVFWHASGTLYSAAGLLLAGRLEKGLHLFQEGLQAYRATGAGLGLPYYLSIVGEALTHACRFGEARRVFDEAFSLVEATDERFQEAELHRLRGELHLAEAVGESSAAEECFRRALEIARRQASRSWELRAAMSLARLWHGQGHRNDAFTLLTPIAGNFNEGLETPDLTEAAAFLKELDNERMRDDIDSGIRYVRGCIPPPVTEGAITVDWLYVPSSTLGGDTIGYHWIDEGHLAFYLIDVTGHGLDSALLAVTITNVIRSGSLSGVDLRQPDQVLTILNKAFQGKQHGNKYFTIWYGVYATLTRTLTHASGGHPSAIVIAPGGSPPQVFPATGPVMGILPEVRFSAAVSPITPDARLVIFSDGVYEVRRDKKAVWDLDACISHLAATNQGVKNYMADLLGYVRELRGSVHLDDDFSIIVADFH